MIESATITNFKGIHNLQARFGRFSLLVGPNGVGKTSVLEAIALVGHAARYRRGSVGMLLATGREASHWILRHDTERLRITVETTDGGYGLEVARRGEASLLVRRGEGVYESANEIEPAWSARHLALDPAALAQDAISASGRPQLGDDGGGIAVYLQYLHGLRDGSLDAIERTLTHVVPRFRRVQFRPVNVEQRSSESIEIDGTRYLRPTARTVPGVALYLEFVDGAVVPALHVSEGTLLALATLAAAMPPSGGTGTVLLIDDLDRALHPAAQAKFCEMLHATLDAVPDLQIIATTHSPDLVDACKLEEVLVMGFHPALGPVARPLSEHSDATRYRTLLRTGEFWGTVGEDWVAENGSGA